MRRKADDNVSKSEKKESVNTGEMKKNFPPLLHKDPESTILGSPISSMPATEAIDSHFLLPRSGTKAGPFRRQTLPGSTLSTNSLTSQTGQTVYREPSSGSESIGSSSDDLPTTDIDTGMRSCHHTNLPPGLFAPETSHPSVFTSAISKQKSNSKVNSSKLRSTNSSSLSCHEEQSSTFLLDEKFLSSPLLESHSLVARQNDQNAFDTGVTSHPQLALSLYEISDDNLSHTFSQVNFSGETNFKASYARRVPFHLQSLVEEIHELDDHDLTHIAYITEKMVKKEVYSLLPYSGANWFLPEVSRVDESKGEKRWGIDYHGNDGLRVSIRGTRLSLPVLNFFIRLGLLALLWVLLWLIVADEMEPGGYVFDPVILLLVSAVVGGVLCRILSVPPLVGVMWVAIMWHNIPELDYLTSGISTQLMEVASKAGLTVILAKAGFSISLTAMKPHWKQTLLLAIVPFAVEGVVGSVVANAIMPYNGRYKWAFLQGMLCAVASPAVVIPGAHFLKNLGYDEEKDKKEGVGPLSLMMSAIPLEVVLGIWCANFILSLLFEQQSVAIAIVLAPAQLLGGAFIGFGIGWLFHIVTELLKQEAARLPNGRFPPAHFRSRMKLAFFLYMVLCLVMVIGGYKLKLAGGGCVMCVSFCATVSFIWSKPRKVHRVRDVQLSRNKKRRRGRRLRIRHRDFRQRCHHRALYHSYNSFQCRNNKSQSVAMCRRLRAIENSGKEVIEEFKEQRLFIGAYLSDLWDQLMMPVLFSAMGARIDLVSVFSKSFFPKAISILLISTSIRFICIMAIQCWSPMCWKRRLLVGIGYLGKASAQASVGPLAASMMSINGAALWGPGGTKEDLALFEEYTLYATYLRNITALYVMVMAVAASIGVVRGGIILLDLKKKKEEKTKSAPLEHDDAHGPTFLSKDLA